MKQRPILPFWYKDYFSHSPLLALHMHARTRMHTRTHAHTHAHTHTHTHTHTGTHTASGTRCFHQVQRMPLVVGLYTQICISLVTVIIKLLFESDRYGAFNSSFIVILRYCFSFSVIFFDLLECA